MADATEPAVKKEDIIALLKQYTPDPAFAREKDRLSGQYRLLMNQPLPALGSPFAKAYNAQDEQSPATALYALVFDNNVPLRQKNIEALKEFRHPNLIALLDEGVVEISTLSEARYVVILERPTGQSLSQVLSQGKNPVSETILVNYLLRPLAEVLLAFNTLGISHGRINLNNVYLGNNTIILGECISEPSGFSQPYLFEPIDRALTSPWAKAEYAISADCYAFAVLALHLAVGFQPFAHIDREFFINDILARGPYHVLALEWDFPDTLQDFFRGLLNDSRRERWDPKNIESWLAGRRFNLIMPSQPRETSRGFEFIGQAYFNRKIIAHSMFLNWKEGRTLLFDNRLIRWIETALHKIDVAATIARIASSNNGDNPRAERQNNDLLARVIIALDPQGPIRLNQLSIAVEGLGLLLTHAFLTDSHEELQTLLQMIDGDLVGFWIEQQKSSGIDFTALTNKLQKVRQNMRMTALGFGMERCIYDLHPGLPCQSPQVKRYYITTIADLLSALDLIAPQKAANDEYIDRHIAGFIASKLNINKEIRINELDVVPELAHNPQLIALKLLARAQQKAGNPTLKGLCYWSAIRFLPLLSTLHKRSLRQELQIELKKIAGSGELQAIAGMMFNADIFVKDYTGFKNAVDEYKIHGAEIAILKSHKSLARHARMAGRGIAQTIAYSVCLMVIYYTLKSYFHF